MRIVSAPIKIKIIIIERQFKIIVKFSTSLSFINQNEIAAAYSGNLIQAIPLTREISINKEKYEESTEVQKKNKTHFIQDIFNQDQENFSVLETKNATTVNVMKMSTKDLLIIIKNGINNQVIIKNFSCNNLVFNNEKKSKLIFLI